jgi:hypothetical protein
MPEAMRHGLCTTHPHPGLWASASPPARGLAASICGRCPALVPCATWALHLPPGDPLVWGGMTPAQRQRIRRAQQRAAARPAA